MRAAYYRRRGAARDVLELGVLPTPEPGPGEVRVRVHASGVNPSDVKSRSGVVARFPLERIAEAHEAVEGGRMIGNVVVEIA